MKRNQVMDRTWLERARREKGFTQEQVAEAVAKGIAKCLEYLNEYGN